MNDTCKQSRGISASGFRFFPGTLVAFFLFLACLAGVARAEMPVADAGADVTVSKDELLCGQLVLDGTLSSDPDGDSIIYQWFGPFPEAQGAGPLVAVPEGSYRASLIVSDETARSVVDTALVTVTPCFSITPRAKGGLVQLVWTNIEGTERYDVYRSHESDPGAFVKIAETTSTYSTHLDDTVTNENTYLYVVGALSGGTWCYSNVVSSHPTAVRTRSLVNYAPVIYSSPIEHGMAGIVYNYDVNATDPNGNALTYSLVAAPPGMEINSSTGLIAWTPSQPGSYDVEVHVSDGSGGTADQGYSLVVGELPPLNQPPVADAGGPYTGLTGHEIQFDGTLSADPDSDGLSFLWDFGDGATGTGSTPVHAYAEADTYTVMLTVSDGRGGFAEDSTSATIHKLPTVSISADPSMILAGDASILAWTSSDADTVSIDNDIGSVELNGSTSTSPGVTTTYTISAVGPGGTSTDSCTVTVCYPPSVKIYALQDTIVDGVDTLLTWTSSNVLALTIDNGIGDISAEPNGATAISPSSTTTYTITATGPCGTATDSVTVAVEPVPHIAISADPVTIIVGSSSAVSWTSENAESVSIDNGIGTVEPQGSTIVSPLITTTYTGSAHGPGMTVYDSVTVVVLHPPVVDISAEPMTIAAGDSSVLTWASENTDAVAIDNGVGNVGPEGMLSVSPAMTTTYRATTVTPDGSAVDSVTVTVIQPPTVSIWADPNTIIAGEPTILSWSSTDADSVSIDNRIGTVGLNGSSVVSPAVTTTYTVVAHGQAGTATDDVTVIVLPVPTVTLSADPEAIVSGGASSLSWITENASEVFIDNGVGSVDVSGTSLVSPTRTTTYTITASGDGGSATDSVTITVYQAPAVSITAAPDAIIAGTSSSLSWTSTHAETLEIDNGIGPVEPGGSSPVSPESTTTYTISASGPGGAVTDSVTVTVYEPPTVSISADPNPIVAGEATSLAWTSTNADTAVIDRGIGYVNVIDTQEISPSGTTTYTITVTGPGGTATDSVIVVVNEASVAGSSYAYITNNQGTDVSVIDLSSNTVVAGVEVGSEPYGVAVSPDGTQVYVACMGGGVYIIDAADNTVVGTIEVPATTVAVSPDGSTLYAASMYENELSVIDTLSNEIRAGIEAEYYPHGIAVSPDGSRVYLAKIRSGCVSVLDATSLDVIDNISLAEGSSPLEVEVSPDGSVLYVTSYDCVWVVDTATNTIIDTIDIFFLPGMSASPRSFAISPDGSRAYVSTEMGYLFTIDTATNEVAAMMSLGEVLSGMSFTPDGTYLYAPDALSNSVHVIETLTNTVVDTVQGEMNWPYTCGHFIAAMNSKVSGRVISNGTGIEGVKVTIRGEALARTTLTDQQGRYTLFVPEGEYSIGASREGYVFSPETVSIQIGSGGATVQDIDTYLGVDISTSVDAVVSGESFVLSWDSTNASSLSIDNGIGSVTESGSIEVFSEETTVYTITGTSSDGQRVSSSQTLVVFQPPGIDFSVDHLEIAAGGTCELLWECSDTYHAWIDNSIGRVVPVGSMVVSPSETTSYTITATGLGGTETASVSITVHQPPEVELSLEPAVIIMGEAAGLSWTSNNAETVSIEPGIGTVEANGLVSLSPDVTTTYTVTAAGPGGTVSEEVTVTVYQRPSVNISSDVSEIITGETAELHWTSENGQSISIDNSVGTVSANGSAVVSPTETTTYTITATGPGGSVSDSVTITVMDPLITVTYPAEGSSIFRPDTLVRGTINHTLTGEVGVTVNGVPALVYQDQFVANHIDLTEGDNSIIVQATDAYGHTAGARVIVYSEVAGPYITLSASDEIGVCPLEITLRLEPAFSPDIATITPMGSGQIEFLENGEDGEYRVRIDSQGVYSFTAQVMTDSGEFLDVVTVQALDKGDLEALLDTKWERMRTALVQNDVVAAASCFCNRKRELKYNAFSSLSESQRIHLAQELEDVQFISMMGRSVEYDIRIFRDEREYSFYLLFEMDEDGLWKIVGF